MPPESPLAEPPFSHRAEQLRADAQAAWYAEAGRHDARELDDLRRTMRADLCDMLLAEEWDRRRV